MPSFAASKELNLYRTNKTLMAFIFTLIFALLEFIPAFSQSGEINQKNFGLFGGFTLEGPAKSFKKFDGLPSCCPNKREGYAIGFIIGGDVSFPLLDSGMLSFSVGPNFRMYRGGLYSDEEVDTYLGRTKFRHSFDYSISSVGIRPSLTKKFTGNGDKTFSLYLFGDFSYLTSSYFKQSEKIIGKGSYTDGSTSRNVASGKVPGLIPFQTALGIGTNFNKVFKWVEDDRWIGVFMEFSYSLTKYSTQSQWRPFFIELGFRYNFAPSKRPEPEPVIEPAPEPEIIPEPEPSVAEVDVYVPPAQEPEPVEKPEIVIDLPPVVPPTPEPEAPKLIRRRIIPLLNYVFFEESSTEIPKRYNSISPENAKEFNEKDVRGGALEVYYNVLNIIGSRMKLRPSAKIKLTGYNNNTNQEAHNERLSYARARAVRKYLVERFGIDSNRIDLDAHNLPKDATRQNEAAGLEENRRVEITTNYPELLAPAAFSDTVSTASKDSAQSFALVLFEFSSSRLMKDQINQINYVKTYFDREDIASIEGYSDTMGELDINEKISLDRALGVAKRLELDKSIVMAVGEGSMLFDNDTPEGRFYCRSVVIKLKPTTP